MTLEFYKFFFKNDCLKRIEKKSDIGKGRMTRVKDDRSRRLRNDIQKDTRR